MHLIHRMGRKPDDFLRTQQATRIGHRKIVLSQMHPVGLHGQCQVTAIVDDQDSSDLGCRLM
jgi:hypothetical protein